MTDEKFIADCNQHDAEHQQDVGVAVRIPGQTLPITGRCAKALA